MNLILEHDDAVRNLAAEVRKLGAKVENRCPVAFHTKATDR